MKPLHPIIPECPSSVHWWEGEYEGYCVRDEGHEGYHTDGLSRWDDDGEDLTPYA